MWRQSQAWSELSPGLLLQVLVQQYYSHNYDLLILTMNSHLHLFLSPPIIFGMFLPSAVTLYSLIESGRMKWGSIPLRVGVLVIKISEMLSIFPALPDFWLTCLINNADCFVNDSYKFSKGKTSLHLIYPNVAHAHRANLAYHSEFFRLLSS